MLYPHDVIRQRLLERAGIVGHFRQTKLSLEEIFKTQWDNRFEQYMRNRLAMGFFRYGNLKSKKRSKQKYDNIGSAKRRLEMYLKTGNQEYLVDAANLCMVEFMVPSCHDAPWFGSVDDGEHTKEG